MNWDCSYAIVSIPVNNFERIPFSIGQNILSVSNTFFAICDKLIDFAALSSKEMNGLISQDYDFPERFCELAIK